MIQTLVKRSQIVKVTAEGHTDTSDFFAVEEPLEIRLVFGPENRREEKNISITMRTPGNDFELAMGFLFTEGIIRNPGDIIKTTSYIDKNEKSQTENLVIAEINPSVEFDITKLERHFYTTSSCGVCGKTSIQSLRTQIPHDNHELFWQIDKHLIFSLPSKLRLKQEIFDSTGGLHACALFNHAGDLETLREDVGRHNALDKLIGANIKNKTANEPEIFSLKKYILLLSGRASFELIQKAAVAGIKMVCAVGAPSSLAIELARESGITLIGFLRDSRFNIYCHENRVTY